MNRTARTRRDVEALLTINEVASTLRCSRDTIERRQLAWHEAGHGLVCWAVGGWPGPLSVRATRRWGGVCFNLALPTAPAELRARVDVGRPLLEWPTEVRTELEARLLITVGGIAAVQLMPSLPPGLDEYEGSSGDADVHALLDYEVPTPVQPLTGTELELLASGDDPDAEPMQTDLEQAFELAMLMLDDEGAAHHYVAAHVAMARRLLQLEELKARRLSRLGDALLEHESLSAATATQLLAENPWQRRARTMPAIRTELEPASGAVDG